jgi:ArsR family transcriptional regulator
MVRRTTAMIGSLAYSTIDEIVNREDPMAEPALSRQKADHARKPAQRTRATAKAIERAAGLFRAMGDGPRLRIMEMLAERERCVTEIVEATGEKFSTIFQRLRVLRSEGLAVRRRTGTHIFYALADRHVTDLIHNALKHAVELDPASKAKRGGEAEMDHHAGHAHQHGPN